MKNITFIIACLYFLLPNIVEAQYKKFIDESKLWVIKNEYATTGQIPPADENYFFAYFKGDSLINGKNYKKLFHQTFYYSTWMNPNPPYPYINDTLQAPSLAAFLREDTTSQQVFLIYNDSSFPTEELQFDFSLNPGDTLFNRFTSSFGSETGIIDSISEIVLTNNDTCKTLFFDYQNGQTINNLEANYIIEAIGGPGGIIYPFSFISLSGGYDFYEIICYNKDSINLFGNCIYPSYYTTDVADDPITLVHNIEVYPNPTNFNLTIELNEQPKPNTIFKLFDITGKEVYSQSLKQSLSSIDVSSYPKGVYLYTILKNDNVHSGKLIIN